MLPLLKKQLIVSLDMIDASEASTNESRNVTTDAHPGTTTFI